MAAPFARARQLFALVAAAMALPFGQQREALAGIPEYRSQGKGRARHHPAKCYRRDQRAARKARNVQRNRKAHR